MADTTCGDGARSFLREVSFKLERVEVIRTSQPNIG